MYKEVKGNLISMALSGEFDVIAHGVNCFCVQGAGLAPQMVKAFGTDTFPLEALWRKGDFNKLGQIDCRNVKYPLNLDKDLWVVNAYTQYNYGSYDKSKIPLDYEALTLCLRKMNHIFKGKHIGLPQLGAGLAKGNWSKIKKIIQKELIDCNVTVVIYDKN